MDIQKTGLQAVNEAFFSQQAIIAESLGDASGITARAVATWAPAAVSQHFEIRDLVDAAAAPVKVRRNILRGTQQLHSFHAEIVA